MTYKTGDKFKIEKQYIGSFATVNVPTNWSNGVIYIGNYQVNKITETEISFENENDLSNTNWYIMKKEVFKKIAVFDRIITGYKLLKDSLNADADSIFDMDGKLISEDILKILDKDVRIGVQIEKLSDTNWFEPVYEEKFKAGDWVYDVKNKFTNIRNKCLQINEINSEDEVWCNDFKGSTFLDYENFCSHYRKATQEEITAQLSKKTITNLGSNNISLVWDGEDTLRIEGRSKTLSLYSLQEFYIKNMNFSIGDFSIAPVKDIRCFQVGCNSENNLVSLDEIEKVINFCV